jgi:hypothetical protein
MDQGVQIILFGGAVLAAVLVLISHANGQAKITREAKLEAERILQWEADDASWAAEEEAERRRDERALRRAERNQEWHAKQYAERVEREEKEDRRRGRRKHHVTRNTLRQAAEKRKARRLYPAGVVK